MGKHVWLCVRVSVCVCVYVCMCVRVIKAVHSHLQTAWEWIQRSRHRAVSWTTAVSVSQSSLITRCLYFIRISSRVAGSNRAYSHVYFMSLLCTRVCEGAWGLALSLAVLWFKSLPSGRYSRTSGIGNRTWTVIVVVSGGIRGWWGWGF